MEILEQLELAGCKLIKQTPNKTDRIVIEACGDWNDADYVRETSTLTVERFLEKYWPVFQKFLKIKSRHNIGNLRDMILYDEGSYKPSENQPDLNEAGFTPDEVDLINQYCPSGGSDGCEVHSLDLTIYYVSATGEKYEIK